MNRIAIVAATVATMAASGVSASTFSGSFWDAPGDTFSNIGGAITYATNNSATANFVSTGIDYGDSSTNWDIGTLADFLNADAGSIDPAAAGAFYFQESVLSLTGFVELDNGDAINVTSDDGFRLIIGGDTVLEFAGIRAPNNTSSTSWAGESGVFAVTLWYFEGQETQAQLISNLGDYAVPAPIPLPAAGWMLLAGIGGIAAIKRRKKA